MMKRTELFCQLNNFFFRSYVWFHDRLLLKRVLPSREWLVQSVTSCRKLLWKSVAAFSDTTLLSQPGSMCFSSRHGGCTTTRGWTTWNILSSVYYFSRHTEHFFVMEILGITLKWALLFPLLLHSQPLFSSSKSCSEASVRVYELRQRWNLVQPLFFSWASIKMLKGASFFLPCHFFGQKISRLFVCRTMGLSRMGYDYGLSTMLPGKKGARSCQWGVFPIIEWLIALSDGQHMPLWKNLQSFIARANNEVGNTATGLSVQI